MLMATNVAQAQSAAAPVAFPDRWVAGSQVNLRAEPSSQATVLRRLALNLKVRALDAGTHSGYCEVEVAAAGATPSVHGYTACQYLAMTPLDLNRLGRQAVDDGKPNPDYDPAKLFWLKPSWSSLEAYGIHLANTRLTVSQRIDPATPRPPDAEYERMKAHLGKGIYGDAPEPWPTWSRLQKISSEVLALPKDQPLIRGQMDMDSWLNNTLMLGGPLFDTVQLPGNRRAAALVKAIVLPEVSSSLFKQATDLASGKNSIESLSGRFHTVVRYQSRLRTSGENGMPDGAWDVGAVTASLTQPLVRTTLYRDGRVLNASEHIHRAAVVWGNDEPPMCDGFEYGFAEGDADPALWRYPGLQDINDLSKRSNDGRLMSILTRNPLPTGKRVSVQVQRENLNREATGFVRGTLMSFDLNVDGVSDVAVWEGVGRGPGHLEGETTTDDAYHRLFFVNIAGQWLLMGFDTFAYGCGC